MKGIDKVISTSQRDGYDKYKKSDIDEANWQAEEYHEEVKIQGEENCDKEKDKEKEKKITKRRSTVILKR